MPSRPASLSSRPPEPTPLQLAVQICNLLARARDPAITMAQVLSRQELLAIRGRLLAEATRAPSTSVPTPDDW
jgi:hypothetical protein